MSKKTRVLFWIIIIVAVYLIVRPAFQRNRIKYPGSVISLGNLKQIGLALWMYAEDNNDVFPDNLKQIDSYLGSSSKYIFNSPLKPRDFNGPSHIYVNGHSFKDAKAKEKYIIAYENPEYLTGYEPQKVNVTYLDGSVDRLKKEDFLSKLKATYDHLGKPIPEIKFKEQVPVKESE